MTTGERWTRRVTMMNEHASARETAPDRPCMFAQIPAMALALSCLWGSAVRAQNARPARSHRAGAMAQTMHEIMPQLRRAHYRRQPPPIPPDFMYNGRPVEAVCLESFVDDDDQRPRPVLLKDCPRPSNILDCELSRNHDNDPWWDLRGFRGYCFEASGNGAARAAGGQFNIVYKYLGKWRGHHALLVESGQGISASAVERHVLLADVRCEPPALVLVRMFASGTAVPIDARIAGDKLLYTASVQGAQFAELCAVKLPRELSPLDFPDSGMLADTDVAKFENGELKSVTLMPYSGKRPEARPGAAGTHLLRRECFGRVHQKYLSTGRTELAPPAIRLFVQNVIDCMEAIH